MQVNFSRSLVEPVNLKAHATACLTKRDFCAILGGVGLAVQSDCTIYGRSS